MKKYNVWQFTGGQNLSARKNVVKLMDLLTMRLSQINLLNIFALLFPVIIIDKAEILKQSYLTSRGLLTLGSQLRKIIKWILS